MCYTGILLSFEMGRMCTRAILLVAFCYANGKYFFYWDVFCRAIELEHF